MYIGNPYKRNKLLVQGREHADIGKDWIKLYALIWDNVAKPIK